MQYPTELLTLVGSGTHDKSFMATTNEPAFPPYHGRGFYPRIQKTAKRPRQATSQACSALTAPLFEVSHEGYGHTMAKSGRHESVCIRMYIGFEIVDPTVERKDYTSGDYFLLPCIPHRQRWPTRD